MREPAYIDIAADGHVTLFWGDGTEAEKYVLYRGPRAPQGQELADLIEEMKLWAEENGYQVVVPAYDLEVPRDMEIEVPEEEIDAIDLNEVDNLLDDLYYAGDYGESDTGSQPDDSSDGNY
jgi:hypothetical protein